MIEIKHRYTNEVILTVDSDALVGVDLSNRDLRGCDLSNSDLRDSNLSGSNLSGSDLRGSNLSGSNLINSNLSRSNLYNSNLSNCELSNCNLSGSNLSNCDLSRSNLRFTNLSRSDLDFACMPLWCGDLKAGYDDKQIIQQLYHVLSHVKYSPNASDDLKSKMLTDELIELANRFHRANECGKLTERQHGTL